MSRPSAFTQEIADEICERISNGESLRTICLDEHMPGKSTVFRWLSANEAFQDHYARARELQAETLFDDVLEIADDARNDWMERRGEEDVGWAVNGENIQRSKLRIDARKWMAGKLQPKKYGERVEHELSGKLETSESDPRQLSRAILAVLSEAALEEKPEE